jgi:hypothetical protein
VTARVVRPVRTLCRFGRCAAPATQRITSPDLFWPVERCDAHVGESKASVLLVLAEGGHPTEVTVTPISREG